MADKTGAAELLKSLLPKSPWFDESWKNAYRSCGQDVKESEMIFRENLVKYDVYCKGHGGGWTCPVELRPPTEDEVCELQFYELEANGENYVGFEAQDSIDEGKIIWELPAADGVYWETWFTNGNNDPDGDDESTLMWGWPGTGNTFLGHDVIAGGNYNGGYDTYIGHEAGYYSTTATANVSVGAGSGMFLETTYVIDPDVLYTFTQRQYINYPHHTFFVCQYGDYLVSRFGTSTPSSGALYYKSTDGINWTLWFSIYPSNMLHVHGSSMVEFNNKLYINNYANPSAGGVIYSWDGNTVAVALAGPLAQDNYCVSSMCVSGGKLWVVTDVTPTVTDRRVCYWSTDGAAFTAVTNYDGVAYIPYNTQYKPEISQYLSEVVCTRWLEYGSKLYLFAAYYDTTTSKYAWKIWEAGTTAFTEVFDSSDSINDGYCLSSVVTNGSIIIVTANDIASNGAYKDGLKVYRSTAIDTGWETVATTADRGVCFSSIEYGTIFYSMFHRVSDTYYTSVYYWDDENRQYVQCNNDITTGGTMTISGNIAEYKGSFFVGMAYYLYELTTTKTTSITVTSDTASGNTIVGAAAGDMPISGNVNCLYGYNSNISYPEIENAIAIGAYSRVSRSNTLVLGGTDTHQVDVVIGKTYAIGRLDVYQYGAKETTNYGAYVQNVSTNETHDAIDKYGIYVSSTGTFTGLAGTACNNYGIYVDAITGADTNYGIYSEDNITTEDQFISSLAIGTMPINVTSTTVCTNLNADLLDGSHASAFASASHNLLSATHADSTAGTVVLGDLVYGDATPKWVRLAGQTTAVKQYLSQTGNGAISAVPAWATIAQADITGLKTSDSPTFAGLTIGSLGGILLGTAGVVSAITNNSANWDTAYGWGDHSGVGYLTAVTAHNVLSTTHGDTTVSAPNNGDVLTWNGGTSKWVAAAAAGGAVAFLDLTDVDEANYTGHAAQFVVVNGTEDGLVFSASSVAGHDLGSASHTDVNAAAPSDDDILRYDTASGKWVNEALPAASNHDLLSATHADTLASAVSRGSIIYGNDTPKWAELVVGTAGYFLKSDGTDVAWADPAHVLLSATHSDALADTVVRGDILYGNATPKWARLAKGTSGYVLTMGANEPAWAAAGGGGDFLVVQVFS